MSAPNNQGIIKEYSTHNHTHLNLTLILTLILTISMCKD